MLHLFCLCQTDVVTFATYEFNRDEADDTGEVVLSVVGDSG